MPSTEVVQRLGAWISADTWYSGRPDDMQRFFHLVHALWLENRSPIDEAALREHIAAEVRRRHPGFKQAEAKKYVQQFARDAQLILEYRDATRNASR